VIAVFGPSGMPLGRLGKLFYTQNSAGFRVKIDQFDARKTRAKMPLNR
jgi:hypothetical protein